MLNAELPGKATEEVHGCSERRVSMAEEDDRDGRRQMIHYYNP